ncbi:YqjF family protein [Halobellus ruber]|uniref:DUF2071 domain-containing protein n=1 Tax=Halobellus ruber TaxID=2761102 RepID=A0A7J9SG10_9EURY|nr:DUF2071 domain-containing protein [Halobellus ruber]MBB6645904.1 DUF2071 domain-containing protein [Halobellus ruber]
MPPRFTVVGSDVLFAHWPLDPEAVDALLPADLAVDTFEGSAWVSALALDTVGYNYLKIFDTPGCRNPSRDYSRQYENRSAAPGSLRLRAALERGVPQLNFRTYVTRDGDDGVYFLSLDTGHRAAAAAGRGVFGLPFHHARMRLTRRDGRITFRSRREGEGSAAVFQARYRPEGERYRAEPGSLAGFCIERYRYFLPAAEAGGAAALRTAGADRAGTIVGRIDRDPWKLRPVDATVRGNTLFEAAGLPAPDGKPVVHYSPGFEMGVLGEEVRSAADRRGDRGTTPLSVDGP